MQIRVKLTLLFGVVVATILLLFSFSIYYFYSLFREIEFYERLKDKAIETVELLTEVKTIDENTLKIIDKHDLTTLFGEEVMMYDNDFKLLYKSGLEYVHLPPNILKKIKGKLEVKIRTGERETIGTLVTDKGRNFIVLVSAVDRHGYTTLSNLLIILTSGWFISVILVFIVGYYFSDSALDPIAEVVRQVDKITASNLNMRVNEGNGKDEIAQLAFTFNNMLKRLEESFIMQKNFVANASHELRTPMTSVRGHIEVALMQERPKEEYIKTLHSILDDVNNLTNMSNGLLELAKVSSDEYIFKHENIRIDELMWQTRSDLMRKQPDYKIRLEFENFPDDEEKLYFKGNESLLKTAFINLMENGCKFSKDNSVDILIIIFFNKILLLFMDNGIGIPKEDLNHIFQPFYRSNKSRNISGYGIGLSLVDKIVKLHKGLIDVNSAENVGTIFTVTLFKEDVFRVNKFAK